MFAAFMLQIVFRYVLNLPIGWTNEISVILWIWLVLWGAAFVVREEEEIRFDLFYASVGPRARRIMFLIAAAALIALYAISFPAVLDYVTFMKVESTAYLKIRFDWLFSIYVVFVVAVIVRYLWLGWQALFGKAPEEFDPDQGGVRRMNLASPFSISIVAITALAFLGLPIGHAMIAGSILYLLLAGLDMGTAAEQFLNGMYTNYIILAVPLFILAAELMNIGSMTERLLRFCNAVVGRFRGGLALRQRRPEHHLRRHVRVGHRRCRRHRQDDADDDDQGRQVSAELCGGADGRDRRHRADHPAVDPDGHLCARLRCLDRLPLPRRRHPRPADGARRRWSIVGIACAPQDFPGRGADAAARTAGHHLARLSRR